MADTTHLIALQNRLSREVDRLNASRSETERALRQTWVDGIRREIKAEYVFLGMSLPAVDTADVGALLAELLAPGANP